MSFFGTFFKVKNCLIDDDLEETLGVTTNMYYALYQDSLNSPESLRAGRKFILYVFTLLLCEWNGFSAISQVIRLFKA